MLRKVPRKDCTREDRSSALVDQVFIIRGIGEYAEAFGMGQLNRAMIVDSLGRISGEPGSPNHSWDYNRIVDLVWQSGAGDLLRARPVEEARSSNAFLQAMVRYGTFEDLVYWTNLMSLRGAPDKPRIMIENVGFPLFGSDPERQLFGRKVDLIADLTRDLPSGDKSAILRRVLGYRLDGTLRDPGAVRMLLSALKRNEYDLNGANLKIGKTTKDAIDCSPLMVALSYSDNGCLGGNASPELAMALLEEGVDSNEGRTASGLTALDLARQRVEHGPYSAKFRPVLAAMLAKGARSGLEASATRTD